MRNGWPLDGTALPGIWRSLTSCSLQAYELGKHLPSYRRFFRDRGNVQNKGQRRTCAPGLQSRKRACKFKRTTSVPGWRFHPRPIPIICSACISIRVAAKIGIPFHSTFQVLRGFSTHGKQEAHPTDMQAQLDHSDPRTTLNHYTRTLGPEVI
jgi:integrase